MPPPSKGPATALAGSRSDYYAHAAAWTHDTLGAPCVPDAARRDVLSVLPSGMVSGGGSIMVRLPCVEYGCEARCRA